MGDSPDPRENLTAALVRDYDDEQLVLWIHALQDREEELEAEVERLEAGLRSVLVHTAYSEAATFELLAGLLGSVARIARATLEGVDRAA
jgi:uncharacterized protein YlxW (UPF0749 family)